MLPLVQKSTHKPCVGLGLSPYTKSGMSQTMICITIRGSLLRVKDLLSIFLVYGNGMQSPY